METLTLLDCGHAESPHSDFTTGYGTTSDGKKHCYECCALADQKIMRETGRITLYYSKNKNAVVNWPASLVLPLTHCRESRHNWGLKRRDFWFIFEGFYWHGYQIGEFTEIAHCKKTKDQVK